VKLKLGEEGRRALAVFAIAFVLASQIGWAQNLGQQPQFNTAVQGQTGARPEGAFLNFINWIGNVIAPVGAGGEGMLTVRSGRTRADAGNMPAV
jgi:hypothetical protein